MTNGEGHMNTVPDAQETDEMLEITQALELNRLKISLLTGNNCKQVKIPTMKTPESISLRKVAPFEKSPHASVSLDIHPFIELFDSFDSQI
jgi:hypothetical protein